jgi:hypothetical protein
VNTSKEGKLPSKALHCRQCRMPFCTAMAVQLHCPALPGPPCTAACTSCTAGPCLVMDAIAAVTRPQGWLGNQSPSGMRRRGTIEVPQGRITRGEEPSVEAFWMQVRA